MLARCWKKSWSSSAIPTAWAALVTLVVMEVVLGIDNLVFISILTNKLPEHQRSNARRIGIGPSCCGSAC